MPPLPPLPLPVDELGTTALLEVVLDTLDRAQADLEQAAEASRTESDDTGPFSKSAQRHVCTAKQVLDAVLARMEVEEPPPETAFFAK